MLGFVGGDSCGAVGVVVALWTGARGAVYADEVVGECAVGTAVCGWEIETGAFFCVSSVGSD